MGKRADKIVVVNEAPTPTSTNLISLETYKEFRYSNLPVRTQIEGDKVWFVVKDVCKVLDIAYSGVTLQNIPTNWKGMMSFITPGGKQQLQCISEAGLYKLTFRSNKPEAEAFTNYVCEVILPAIRKIGSFQSNLTPAEKGYLDIKIKF